MEISHWNGWYLVAIAPAMLRLNRKPFRYAPHVCEEMGFCVCCCACECKCYKIKWTRFIHLPAILRVLNNNKIFCQITGCTKKSLNRELGWSYNLLSDYHERKLWIKSLSLIKFCIMWNCECNFQYGSVQQSQLYSYEGISYYTFHKSKNMFFFLVSELRCTEIINLIVTLNIILFWSLI